MKSIGYSSKIENQDSLRGVIDRLPYDFRKKWRNTADQISEDQDIEIKFEDIVVFVEKQARAASHPVFGDISARSWCHEREKNTYSKPKGKSFAIKGEDPDQGRSNENKEDPASLSSNFCKLVLPGACFSKGLLTFRYRIQILKSRPAE